MKRILFALMAGMAFTARGQALDTSDRIELIPGKVWGQRIRTSITVAAMTVVAIASGVDSSAQTPTPAQFNTWVNSQRATVDANITTVTAPNSVGPFVVGGATDSAMHIADSGYNALYSAITSGCTCLFQNVLNNGNTASNSGGGTNYFQLLNSSGYSGAMGADYWDYRDDGGRLLMSASSGNGSAQPDIELADISSSYSASIQDNPLTGNRNYYLPDETNTASAFNNSFVTHTTINPINVGNLSSIYTEYEPAAIQMFNSGFVVGNFNRYGANWANSSGNMIGGIFCSGYPSTFGGLELIDGTSNHNNILITNPHSGSDVTDTFPQRSGIVEIIGDLQPPTITLGIAAGTGGTYVLLPGSDDRSGVIQITTGAVSTTGSIFHLAYTQSYPNNSHVVLFPNNIAAANVGITVGFFATSTASGFNYQDITNLGSTSVYEWSYIVEYN